jgi:hypothetical protein
MRALQRNESVLARSGPAFLIVRYPLVEVKRKWGYASAETANDPERTSSPTGLVLDEKRVSE